MSRCAVDPLLLTPSLAARTRNETSRVRPPNPMDCHPSTNLDRELVGDLVAVKRRLHAASRLLRAYGNNEYPAIVGLVHYCPSFDRRGLTTTGEKNNTPQVSRDNFGSCLQSTRRAAAKAHWCRSQWIHRPRQQTTLANPWIRGHRSIRVGLDFRHYRTN